MVKNTKDSIEKLDEQIEKLTINKYDDTNSFSINKKELKKKIKLAKIDEEMTKNKKKKTNSSDSVTKTIKLDEIKEEFNKTKSKSGNRNKADDTKSLSSTKLVNKKPVKLVNKVISQVGKSNNSISSLDKKKLVNEILDNESEVDKLIKSLTKIFTIFIGILIIFFLIICFI